MIFSTVKMGTRWPNHDLLSDLVYSEFAKFFVLKYTLAAR